MMCIALLLVIVFVEFAVTTNKRKRKREDYQKKYASSPCIYCLNSYEIYSTAKHLNSQYFNPQLIANFD